MYQAGTFTFRAKLGGIMNRGDACQPLAAVALAFGLAALTASANAQEPVLQNIWGPETFTRTTGAPVTIDREFSIAGFEQPFVLHLRSGDESGEKAAPVAWIFLNGDLLFGPSAFTGDPFQVEKEVDLTDPSTLSVKVAGGPGNEITVWVEGSPAVSSVDVGPAGGTYVFPDGLTLSIPPGAVDKITSIAIEDYSCENVEAIVRSQDATFKTNEKYCLRAFRALPTGFTFNLPVELEISLPNVRPNGVLEFISLDQDGYRLNYTTIEYSGALATAKTTMEHFSEHAFLVPEWCVSQECLCRFCETYPENESFCQSIDPLMPSCCQMLFDERVECGVIGTCSVLDCCREAEVRIVSSNHETTVATPDSPCTVVQDRISATYPYCKSDDGTLGRTEEFWEMSISDCPEDMQYELVITDDQEVVICSTTTLQSILKRSSKSNPSINYPPIRNPALVWESLDTSTAIFENSRSPTITGISSGQVTVRAAVPDLEINGVPVVVEDTTSVYVRSPDMYIRATIGNCAPVESGSESYDPACDYTGGAPLEVLVFDKSTSGDRGLENADVEIVGRPDGTIYFPSGKTNGDGIYNAFVGYGHWYWPYVIASIDVEYCGITEETEVRGYWVPGCDGYPIVDYYENAADLTGDYYLNEDFWTDALEATGTLECDVDPVVPYSHIQFGKQAIGNGFVVVIPDDLADLEKPFTLDLPSSTSVSASAYGPTGSGIFSSVLGAASNLPSFEPGEVVDIRRTYISCSAGWCEDPVTDEIGSIQAYLGATVSFGISVAGSCSAYAGCSEINGVVTCEPRSGFSGSASVVRDPIQSSAGRVIVCQ